MKRNVCCARRKEDNHLSGSTAAMVLLAWHKLFASWVGDSRIIGQLKSGSPGDVVAISKEYEKKRIRNAGGSVNSKNIWRSCCVKSIYIYHKEMF